MFMRWNGGGDLFAENVEAINYLGRKRPDIKIWNLSIGWAMEVVIHFGMSCVKIWRLWKMAVEMRWTGLINFREIILQKKSKFD